MGTLSIVNLIVILVASLVIFGLTIGTIVIGSQTNNTLTQINALITRNTELQEELLELNAMVERVNASIGNSTFYREVITNVTEIHTNITYNHMITTYDEPLPSESLIIIVRKGGNDTTGLGTDEAPFLTIQRALNLSVEIGASTIKRIGIDIGPGRFDEIGDLLLVPWVYLRGFQ